ncbi:MAG: hypothetical protein AMJ43_04720 [Coxiella sp. DG_40]|nr:MAG: hypothetical protein AMJ43_04720 [Coxiella sp. DG_40]
MAKQTLKEKLSSKDKWIRLFFMILFAVVIYWVALILVWLITAFQFVYALLVGGPSQALLPFSDSLSQYIHQVVMFLTFVTEEKPFPFKSWPSAKGVIKSKKVSAETGKKE